MEATMQRDPLVRDACLTFGDVRLHYREWGDPAAPPVVLLHAFSSHARSWDTIAHGLADRFCVLALDQRGYGASSWSSDYHELRYVGDLGAVIDALELGVVSIVGFSIGGSHACAYGLLYPDRVRRLVLFESFTAGDEQGDAAWIAVMRSHMRRLTTMPADPAAAFTVFRNLAPYAEEEEIHRWIGAGLIHDPAVGWRWRYDPAFLIPGPEGRLKPSEAVLASRVARLTCPTLVLVGAESWMVEPTRRVAAGNPHVRLEVIPRAGHWIPLDNPAGLLAVLGDFLTNE
jgi:esterase